MSKSEEDHQFRKLVEENAPYIWRVLRSFGVKEADLPDVCQETLIVIHRQLKTFEGRSSIRTWVCGIAIRVASDYRSKAYRRRELPTERMPDGSDPAAQHLAVEQKQAWSLLESLFVETEQDLKKVFVLYEIAQLSMREVAEIVGCPLSTAYSRLAVARNLVQERRAAQLMESA